jgi:hypothetical protein
MVKAARPQPQQTFYPRGAQRERIENQKDQAGGKRGNRHIAGGM